MIPFGRPRHAFGSPHERARARAAERLDQPLEPSEAAWLDRHLAECGACRAIADAYTAQRLELRSLSDHHPEPPRDLWARTAAAIERESAHAGRLSRSLPTRRGRRPSAIPIGAISGLLVVAVVVGASLLARPAPTVAPRQTNPQVAVSLVPSGPASPGATPLSVFAGDVAYLRINEEGAIDVYVAEVDTVCPPQERADCAPIEEAPPQSIDVPEPPRSVVQSPDESQLILADAGTGTDAGGTIYVLAAPTPPSDVTSPSAPPSSIPTVGPTPNLGTATATPTPTPTPTSRPTVAPTPTPRPDESASPSDVPPVTSSPSPSAAPGALQAIARDVVLVGEAAGYSPDGTAFAFSARPADGSHGPDIYVWRAGDPEATTVTSDGRSVFGTWLDGRLLGSRAVFDPDVPAPDPSAEGGFRPQTFLLDPTTGVETVLDSISAWRPSVDPNGRLAVYWDGTLELAPSHADWVPADGRLVLGPWPEMPVAIGPETPGASPTATSGAPSEIPQASAASPSGDAVQIVPSDQAIRDWDARWDESGTHLALWVADETDPTIGRLSLFVIDPQTGRIDPGQPPLNGEAALPGFSIGKGRLAWATPPQNGDGSRVHVLAWTRDAVGSNETAPGDDVAVVIR